MKFRSLQIQLTVIFGLCVIIAVGAVVLYGIVSTHDTEQFVHDQSSEVIKNAARELLLAKAREIGYNIQAELEVALDAARTLADVLSGIKDPNVNLNMDRDRINGILRSVTERNEAFLGSYTVWEPNALDGLDELYAGTEGHDDTGRFIPYWNRGEDGTIKLDPLLDYESQETYANGVRKGEYYLLPRERKKECVIDPYSYPVQGKMVWMTSLVVPIIVENTFYGMAGVDMRLDFIQALVERKNAAFYDDAGTMAIISHNNILAAVSGKPALVGKPLQEFMSDDWETDGQKISAGEEKVEFKDQSIEILMPITIGRTGMPWSVAIELPTNVVLANVEQLAQNLADRGTRDLFWQVMVGLFVTLVVLLVIWVVARGIVRPLKLAAEVADQVADGNLQVEFAARSKNEVGQVLRAMKRMIAYIQDVAGIAEQVADKDLQVSVTPKSEHDVLNHSLAKMVTNLQAMVQTNDEAMTSIAQQNETMKQQNWLKDGVGQLSMTLSGENSLVDVCQKAVNFTARYIDAGQGVLYAHDPEQELLKLYGTFAFTERDQVSNQYKLGEGVIGQVALERSPILLKHPSADECLVVTGTVSAAPLNTYTLPILYEEEVYGVLELASFEPFDGVRQEFLTEAAKVIATALFSTSQRERVQKLLQASQQAAEEAERAKAEAQQQAEESRRANVMLEEKQQELEQQNEEFQQMTAQLKMQQHQLEQQREELRQQRENLVKSQPEAEQRSRKRSAA